jgi:hypothetical protein
LDHIPDALLGQLISHADQWLSVLKDAASHGLIDPADAAAIEGPASLDLLALDDLKDRVIALLQNGPAAVMALDAIAPAFGPGDVIELRAVNPAGGGAVSYCGRLDDPEERKALEAFIWRYLGLWNLYVGCNPRRADMAGTSRSASATDIPIRRCIVLDFDFKDSPSEDPHWTRTVAALKADRDPLLALHSGNGFHVWLPIQPVSGPDVAASTQPLADAMAQVGADNMADPPRIVRLPFTINLPTASKLRRGAIVRLAQPC